MLSRDKRLNLKKDFKWVASGKKLEAEYLKVFISFSNNKIPKIGIATSSKVFNKASKRNKARRIVSESCERLYSLLPCNINIIALPKAGVVNVKSSDVLLDLEKVLRNERIIN